MFKCPNSECSNETLYSDLWVSGTDATGNKTDCCKFCLTALTAVDKEDRQRTAAINTRGCTPVSKNFTY
jgi:hypothetical protein